MKPIPMPRATSETASSAWLESDETWGAPDPDGGVDVYRWSRQTGTVLRVSGGR